MCPSGRIAGAMRYISAMLVRRKGFLIYEPFSRFFCAGDFPVQRPRTLLSPEHVNALVELVKEACSIGSNPPRHGLRLDAAGAGSPTMRRLGKTLEITRQCPLLRKMETACLSCGREIRGGKCCVELVLVLWPRALGGRSIIAGVSTRPSPRV